MLDYATILRQWLNCYPVLQLAYESLRKAWAAIVFGHLNLRHIHQVW